jgi:phosphoserine phosphatase
MYGYQPGIRHVIALAVALACTGAAHALDPLPSWRDGAAKSGILAFVEDASHEGVQGFIPAPQRIAVFDMDGTLIPEKPLPAAVLPIVADVRTAVSRHPELREKPAVSALLAGDLPALQATGQAGLVSVVAAAVDDRTVEEVERDTAVAQRKLPNPRFGRPYTALAYRPMLELLALLRAHGFSIWICSGSPLAFTRGLALEEFGVAPSQVIGSSLATRLATKDQRTVLVYTGAIEQVTDKEGKPPAIHRAIGQRPAFVSGNVGGEGDLAMMRYSQDRDGASFQLLINHDDAVREFAYAEPGHASLDAAAAHHFTVVSMARDWLALFNDPPPREAAGSPPGE